MWESRGYALIIISIILLAITVPPIALYGSGHVKVDENRSDNLFLQIGFVGTAILSFFLIFMGIKIQMDLNSGKKSEERDRLITYEDTRNAPLPPPITNVNEEGVVYSSLP